MFFFVVLLGMEVLVIWCGYLSFRRPHVSLVISVLILKRAPFYESSACSSTGTRLASVTAVYASTARMLRCT